MAEIDTNDVSHNSISDDDELLMQEVIQDEPDLFFLHHYLSEIYRKG